MARGRQARDLQLQLGDLAQQGTVLQLEVLDLSLSAGKLHLELLGGEAQQRVGSLLVEEISRSARFLVGSGRRVTRPTRRRLVVSGGFVTGLGRRDPQPGAVAAGLDDRDLGWLAFALVRHVSVTLDWGRHSTPRQLAGASHQVSRVAPQGPISASRKAGG